MKTATFRDLPSGCEVRGSLYLDPALRYESGDVLEVGLPTGLTIDVGWDDDSSDGPFRIAVYREYFGDRLSISEFVKSKMLSRRSSGWRENIRSLFGGSESIAETPAKRKTERARVKKDKNAKDTGAGGKRK